MVTLTLNPIFLDNLLVSQNVHIAYIIFDCVHIPLQGFLTHAIFQIY